MAWGLAAAGVGQRHMSEGDSLLPLYHVSLFSSLLSLFSFSIMLTLLLHFSKKITIGECPL